MQFCVKLVKYGPNFAGPPISVFLVLAPSGHIVKFRMQFSSKQVAARRFEIFWGPTKVMTGFYNANLLRRITFFSFLDCGPFKRLAAPLRSNRGPRAFVSRLMICIVFYELYAHLHRVLRALRKFAPYFTRFTHIWTVFDELFTSLHDLHRVLRALRKLAPYFTSFM